MCCCKRLLSRITQAYCTLLFALLSYYVPAQWLDVQVVGSNVISISLAKSGQFAMR